ncbi:MAG: hypothetical protein LUD51_07070 [Clostridia bacterium]|nr:hypothetical protein [Clostridia bacterium]
MTPQEEWDDICDWIDTKYEIVKGMSYRNLEMIMDNRLRELGWIKPTFKHSEEDEG